MANRFWVGGTASWDTSVGTKWAATSGGAGGQSIPTSTDDVFFDASSGAGSTQISTARSCRSLTCTGYTGTLNFTATLSVGNSTGGAVTFASGMTLSANGSGVLSMVATTDNSGAGWPITTAGKTLPMIVIFNGTGGKWTLQDSVTASSSINLTAGTLDTGSQTISAASFASAAGGTRTLTPGSSAITLSGAWSAGSSGLTVSSNTATVTQTGATANFDNAATSGANYNGMGLVQNGSGIAIVGAGSAITLGSYTRSGTAVKTDGVNFGSNLTITSLLTLAGNSTTNRLLVGTPLLGSPITITCNGSAPTVSNADFQDITGAGTASWNLSSATGGSGDCQGNSGITFTTPATQTLVGTGTINWSTAAIWTSRVPLPQDDVAISTTTTTTLTTDMPRMCHNIDFTGFTKTLTHASGATTCTYYGNITLASGMTLTNAGSASIVLAGRGAQTYKSNTKGYPVGSGSQNFSVHAVTGSYTLQDNSSFSQGSTTGTFRLLSGTFNMAGFTLSVSHFSSATTTWARTLTTGGGTVIPSATDSGAKWSVVATNLTYTTPPSITFNTATATAFSFTGGGMTYGALTYTVAASTGALTITDGNTFDTINFSDTTNARTLTFTGGIVSHILTAFNVNGTSGKLMTITSATPSMLVMTSGTVSIDFVSITNSVATGGASWAAGPNSVDGGGNQGWVINGVATASPPSSSGMLAIF